MKNLLFSLATDRYAGPKWAVFKFIMLLFSFIYGAAIRCLIFAYSLKKHRLNCKVISIGNITLGGTGKTSLVKLVALYLKGKGHRLAVLSRGYKKLNQSMGDEPTMLLQDLEGIPVIVDKDRVRGAIRAIREYGVDTVVLDDGLQQWRIFKDLEVVTISSTQGFGNRHMIPRGVLREPLSGLKRAGIFVLTKTNLKGDTQNIKECLTKINNQALLIESKHSAAGFDDLSNPGVLLDKKYLHGKRVGLFCGIGDPGSFTDLVVSLGAKVEMDLRFEDHHHYTQEELSVITDEARENNIEIIVTTQKDASRLTEKNLDKFAGLKLLALRINLEITKNEERFFARLLSLYSI